MDIYLEEQIMDVDSLMSAFRYIRNSHVKTVVEYGWMDERPCLELEDVVEHDRVGADIVDEALRDKWI